MPKTPRTRQTASYRRPNLEWINATTVQVEAVLADSTMHVLFPDGDYRSATNNDSSHRFIITQNAVLSGSTQGGLRTGLSEANNTWYALYAVKVTDSTTNFVLVGDTVLPLRTNTTTLNTNFGTNGWVYLGLIRNGDNAGAVGDILNFVQAGNRTLFTNQVTYGSIFPAGHFMGIGLATTASATTLTYTYSAGTGTTQIPNNIYIARISGGFNCDTAVIAASTGINTNRVFYDNDATTQSRTSNVEMHIQNSVTVGNQTARPFDIVLSGWVDNVLGVGPNPLF